MLHFAILAGLVFLAYSVLNGGRSSEDMTISVSSFEIERLAALYDTEAGTRPNDRDLQALINDHIKQQALAREARALGMADGDVVIERRLVQKMIFMLSETRTVSTPNEDELRAWFDQNQDQFREPERTTFDHIFFSSADDPKIEATLSALTDDPELAWRQRGNPFMLQRSYSDITRSELIHVFGIDFATQMDSLESESRQWQGPLRSDLGTHLVRINARQASYIPEFSDIQNAVEQAWRDQAQRQETARKIQSIVDKYNVEIEGIPRK